MRSSSPAFLLTRWDDCQKNLKALESKVKGLDVSKCHCSRCKIKGYRDKSDLLREINDISVTAGPTDARIAPLESWLKSDMAKCSSFCHRMLSFGDIAMQSQAFVSEKLPKIMIFAQPPHRPLQTATQLPFERAKPGLSRQSDLFPIEMCPSFDSRLI